jgi:TonB-linked SusC/RagA family outer membrane protein
MNTKLYQTLQSVVLGVFLLLLSMNAMAQDRRITGRVTNADGPVPGANVVLKGTTTGVATDAEGNFALNIRGTNPVLVVSAIGSKSQEVAVGNQTTLSIVLQDDATALQEVVVTGYTTDNKRETTGAVATVKAQDLKVVPSANVETQLQGRVAGVTVVASGQPGANNTVRVRGFGAFGGNQPLYVVDGVPTQNTQFLNPDDIESTTILKDASSASIYGARAANGVIVITTKKGQRKAQKLSITYDGLYGFTDPGTAPAVLTPQEQADWTWAAVRNRQLSQSPSSPVSYTGIANGQYGSGNTPVLPDYINVGGRAGVIGTVDLAAEQAKYNVDPNRGAIYQVVRANKQGTDWYKAITRNAPLLRQTLGFSGGTESSRFFVSLGQQKQAGILKYNDYQRYDIRANSEFDIIKNLRFGENFQMTYINTSGQIGDNGGQRTAQEESVILSAFRMAPIIPIYDEFGGYAGTAAKGFNNPRNPVAERDGIRNNRNFNVSAFGNVYLEYDPIPALTLRSSLGGGYSNYYNKGYNRRQYENSENNGAFSLNEGAGYSFNWVFTNTAQYKTRIGNDHSLDVLAGIEALNDGAGRNISGTGQNPFSTDPNYVSFNTTSGSGRVLNGDLFSGVNFYSVFGRANYILMDKYILTGVVRRDGSSRFGSANRYGVFPAFSAAWRISGEEFMKNVPFITDLKIRGGYGLMGNSNNVDPNNQFSLYQSNVANGYDISGSNSSTAAAFFRSRIGNPNAKWETSVTTNVGIDGTFLNGKLDLVLDIWRKDTRDLLFQAPIPGVIGSRASAPAVNVGSMRNQGIDLQVTTRGRTSSSGLGYEVSVNGSFLKNQIQGLAPGVDYLDVGLPTNRIGGLPTRLQAGQPLGSFYGYKVVGLWQSQEDINRANSTAAGGTYQIGAGAGRFRYADTNGDGVVNENDRTFIGSPVPKFTGGVNLRLDYKGFDFLVYAYTSLGNNLFNYSKWFTDFYPSYPGAAISARVRDSWTPTNTGTNQPIFEDVSNISTNGAINSWYVENGSFLRLQNITLGYTLPTGLLDRVGLKRVRVSIAANNIFTISKYSGLDPGVGAANDQLLGIDVGNYPITRSFNAGISVGL